MSFFINDALAAAAPAASSAPAEGGFSSFFLLMLFMLAFYFLLFRPQSRRAKEHKQLVSNLSVGDEVITLGGLYGKITKITENVAIIAIADNLEVKIQKNAISTSVPKGTLKQLEK